MDKVTVKKSELVKIVEENREIHRDEFDEAWDAFKDKAIDNFTELLKAAKNMNKGQEIKLHANLIQPKDHTDDFDRVLKMLQLEVSDEVTLKEDEFSQIVQNDWRWAREFSQAYVSNTSKISKFS